MAYGKEDLIGRWSMDKLAFLEMYLPAYLRATRTSKQRFYIDGFAGKGKWVNRSTGEVVDGSAAIALRYADRFTHLYFVEYSQERAENLHRLIEKHNAQSKATVFNGDCNEELPNIIKRINRFAPTFVFLDPSKDQLRWSTIEKIAPWKTELFILFPLNMTLIRYLPRHGILKPWAYDHLDAVFGTRQWEDLYRTKHRGELAYSLLNLYTQRLQELGYEHVNVSRIFKNDYGQRLYYMIWVGKHPIGKKIMDKVFEQQPGQLELF